MTGPTSAAQQLGKRLDELQQTIAEMREVERDALTKRHDASVAEWKAFLAADGAMDKRKVVSRLDTADQAFAADLAEGEVRHLGRMVRLAQARVDAGRTYSADLRAEAAVAGRDGTP